MQPETRYARSGDVNIAYQVLGEGPCDLVLVTGWVSNLEVMWEEANLVRFLKRLASFSRLILFDKRGTGLSDRVTDMPSLEVRMDDVRAVMDAIGSERAALFGISEGGPMSVLFGATYPARTAALIMAGSYARRTWRPDYPWGPTDAEMQAGNEQMQRDWGGPVGLEARAPSMAHDEHYRQWWARLLRMGASPAAVATLVRMNGEIDVRHVLPATRVPTLILHSVGDRAVDIGGSRYMAAHMPNARLVELPSADHLPWLSDADTVLGEIEELLTGVRHDPEHDRVLATVLFTDIVGATAKAASLGDRRWHDLLDSHHALVRRELARHRGREIDTAGDGFLATFDGPARAIRCACAITDGVRPLGLEIRAGLHTGECEIMGDKVGGVAVHIGARVAALAEGSEVLVSSTVKDLGSLYVNAGQWAALPKSYQAILEAAAAEANLIMPARYDAMNPAALKRLVGSGTQLRPFSREIMMACYDAAFALYDEIAVGNEGFRRIYESWKPFRADEYLWFRVAENTFDNFVYSQQAARK